MKKYFFIVCIFLTAALLNVFILNKIDKNRLFYVQKLDKEAKNEIGQGKIVLLAESDLLQPSDKKKYELAREFLLNHDYSKAEFYINIIESEEWKTKAAELLVTIPNYQNTNHYINKLKSTKIKAELEKFLKITNSSEPISQIESPNTEPGRLINSLNTQDFRTLEGTLPLTDKIKSLQGRSKLNTDIQITQLLAENGQYYLALGYLDFLIKEHPLLIDLHLLSADIYEKVGNYKSALKEYNKALSIDPSRIEIYEKAISAAISDKNGAELERLKRLKEYIVKISQ